MNTKLLTGLVILALGLGGLALFKSRVIERVVDNTFGAITGPDTNFPYLQWGGLVNVALRKELATATTTPCSIQSPASTSTLVSTGFSVTTSTSTAVTITMATSSTAFATTTVYNTFAVGSGQQVSLAQTPTTTVAQVMAANTYVVWSATGFVGAGTTKFLGTCYADFKVL